MNAGDALICKMWCYVCQHFIEGWQTRMIVKIIYISIHFLKVAAGFQWGYVWIRLIFPFVFKGKHRLLKIMSTQPVPEVKSKQHRASYCISAQETQCSLCKMYLWNCPRQILSPECQASWSGHCLLQTPGSCRTAPAQAPPLCCLPPLGPWLGDLRERGDLICVLPPLRDGEERGSGGARQGTPHAPSCPCWTSLHLLYGCISQCSFCILP